MWNAAGMKRPLALFIAHEGLHGLFDSSCFARFSRAFSAGFGITYLVSFLEVDVGSPRTINRGQFVVDGDEDGQMIAGH